MGYRYRSIVRYFSGPEGSVGLKLSNNVVAKEREERIGRIPPPG